MTGATHKPIDKNSIFNFGGIKKGWYALFCFIGVVILIYASRLDNIVLNEPSWLTWGPLVFIAVLLLLVFRKQVHADLNKQPVKTKIFGYGIVIFAAAFVSFLLTSALSIPFYFVNSKVAAANDIVTERCKITGVTIKKGTKTSNSISFMLYGSSNRLYCYTGEMKNLHAKNNYQDYYFIVSARPGLFGTYILDDWKLVRR